MGSESSLKTWVSDKLMTVLGYSQPAVVQYIIGITKQAKSPAEVVDKFVDSGWASGSNTRKFAEEIFSKVPHKSYGPNVYQKQEREAAMLVRKQKTYALLDADDDEDEDDKSSVPVVSESRKSDSHKKRYRKKASSEEDEDDEVVVHQEEVRRVKRRTSPEEDDGSESEEERLCDQREREQLERNIRERDTAATRKLTDRKLSKREEEEAIRRNKASERNETEELRKVSRHEYMKKREVQKLNALRDEIEDEQYLFDNVELTEAEHRELRFKKQILEAVTKRAVEDEDQNEYKIPDAYDVEGGVNQEKRFSVAMQRYRDQAGDKMNPFAEQEAWEDHQIGKATLQYGSKNKKRSDEYQYLFEDQIDFIKASVMDGDEFEDAQPADLLESRAQSELEKLQEDRKTLPIYSYRDELLQAVDDHIRFLLLLVKPVLEKPRKYRSIFMRPDTQNVERYWLHTATTSCCYEWCCKGFSRNGCETWA